jgi:hypothetical protein
MGSLGFCQGVPMNHSLLSADWRTHLKMLIVAILVGSAFVSVGIKARVNAFESSVAAGSGPIVKAQRPIAYSNREIVLR